MYAMLLMLICVDYHQVHIEYYRGWESGMAI